MLFDHLKNHSIIIIHNITSAHCLKPDAEAIQRGSADMVHGSKAIMSIQLALCSV